MNIRLTHKNTKSDCAPPKTAACAVAAALLLAALPAYGQEYPAKPVRIVVGFAVGGPTDLVARASRTMRGAP